MLKIFVYPNLCSSMEPSGKEKELQAELTKKRREFERIRNEKDAARLEVEYMKAKVKVTRIHINP